MDPAAERPVMLHRVLIGSFAHVQNPRVSDCETCFGDEFEEVDTQADLLLVVARSEREGHLIVSGVHHVFVPPGETAGDGLQHGMDLSGDGELCDDDCDGVGVLGELPGAGELHHLLVGVRGVWQQGFGVSQALDQGLDLVEVGLLPEQLRLLEVARQRELRRAQEVEDVAEQRAVAVDEVVSSGVFHCWEVSSEHGAQHGVRVSLQRGQRRAVNAAAHVQTHRLPHHMTQVSILHLPLHAVVSLCRSQRQHHHFKSPPVSRRGGGR
uniref:Uncharacterized protein n=1 Tax=Fundulus heteroclitus TaxID=8078 RepID=A0A146RXV4_FUNHE